MYMCLRSKPGIKSIKFFLHFQKKNKFPFGKLAVRNNKQISKIEPSPVSLFTLNFFFVRCENDFKKIIIFY
jgi:hypothetical protein